MCVRQFPLHILCMVNYVYEFLFSHKYSILKSINKIQKLMSDLIDSPDSGDISLHNNDIINAHH